MAISRRAFLTSGALAALALAGAGAVYRFTQLPASRFTLDGEARAALAAIVAAMLAGALPPDPAAIAIPAAIERVRLAILFAQRVDGYAGAPQSVYSDHFLDTTPLGGAVGYKLEAPPMHPLMMATTMAGFGQAHAQAARQLPYQHAMLALLRDGFHPDSRGGSVALAGDGAPVLDYPIGPFLWDGVRRALLTMAEIQFAAGARSVQPVHEMAEPYTSWAAAQAGIAALPYRNHLARVVSAHVMGGCAMAPDDRLGMVGADGRYHGVRNLSVHDGSLFPTSIGANPQLSIYAITARLASALALALA